MAPIRNPHLSDETETYGLSEAFPYLWLQLKEADQRDKEGRHVFPLHDEAARVLLELWVSRYRTEQAKVEQAAFDQLVTHPRCSVVILDIKMIDDGIGRWKITTQEQTMCNMVLGPGHQCPVHG